MTPNDQVHHVSDRLLHKEVSIHLIGCGGTGSQLAPRLAQLSKCLVALGHPYGLHVTVWDVDTVSEHIACARTSFCPM